jgi:NADPH2:quinone reductase
VVHSAAGGVGSIAVQLAKPMGASRVIATASSEEKRALALELGADIALDPEDDLGEKVDIVFETAGGPLFERSFDALAPFGRIVQYGLSTREKTRVSNANLLKTSRGIVGFWLMHCIGRPGMLREPLEDLFARAARGEVVARVGEAYPLSEVARAHEDLLSRRTSGKLIVDPSIA